MFKGELIINGNDAYTTYGVFFYQSNRGGYDNLSALLTPPAVKSYVAVNYRERDGEEVSKKEPRFEARDITLVFGMLAENTAAFRLKYTAFVTLLKMEWINLAVTETEKTYKLHYQSCSGYKQLTRIKQLNSVASTFTVKFREPKPSI